MAVKLVRLKSGEEIVANIKEVFSKENNERPLAYVFEDACIVGLEQSKPEVLNEDAPHEENIETRIVMRKWLVLTEDKSHMIPLDWVITFANPAPDVLKVYEARVQADTEPATLNFDGGEQPETLNDIANEITEEPINEDSDSTIQE